MNIEDIEGIDLDFSFDTHRQSTDLDIDLWVLYLEELLEEERDVF